MKMVISHTYVPNGETISGLEQLLFGVLGIFTDDGVMKTAINRAMDKFAVPEEKREFAPNIYGKDSKVFYLDENYVYTDEYDETKYVIELTIMEMEPNEIMQD